MPSLYIFGAQYLVFVMALVAGGYWISLPKQQKLYMVVYGVITAVVAFALAKLGASLFHNPRPFVVDHTVPLIAHGNDNGFPSDHTLLAGIIAGTVLAVSRKWGLALAMLALVVGLARVAVHVHHVIDVLGSLGFVAIGGLAAWYATSKAINQIAIRRR